MLLQRLRILEDVTAVLLLVSCLDSPHDFSISGLLMSNVLAEDADSGGAADAYQRHNVDGSPGTRVDGRSDCDDRCSALTVMCATFCDCISMTSTFTAWSRERSLGRRRQYHGRHELRWRFSCFSVSLGQGKSERGCATSSSTIGPPSSTVGIDVPATIDLDSRSTVGICPRQPSLEFVETNTRGPVDCL